MGSDLHPVTRMEAGLAMLASVCGMYLLAYVNGQIYSIIVSIDAANAKFQQLMADTQAWFELRSFPPHQQRRLHWLILYRKQGCMK
jgi:hypothetical protein